MTHSFLRRSLYLFLVLPVLVGCGDSLSSLQGNVTIDGQPAGEGVMLQFTPVDGGSSSSASTDADGHYVAQFTFQREGIEPGKHLVQLMPGGGERRGMPELGSDGKPIAGSSEPSLKSQLPDRYYEEIETITVDSGSNQHDFALSTESQPKDG